MSQPASAVEKTVNTPRIKIGEKLGFMTFSGSNNIIYQFKNLYFLFFLTDVIKIPVGWAGMIVTIGTIWDAVNDPLIGYWSVNRRFKNGEWVRPFALWHSIPWAITLVLMFTDFGVSDLAAAGFAMLFYIVFEVFNTTVGLPYNSMSGLATPLEADRRSLNVFRNLGSCIGSAVSAVACLPMLQLFGALDKNGNFLKDTGASRGFILVAGIIGVIAILGSLLHYATTKERVKQISQDNEKIKVGRLIRMLVTNRSWWFNTIFVICYLVVNFLLMNSINYYATYVIGSSKAATPILAAFLAVSVLATLFVSPVDKKLGRRKTMMLGAAIAIAGKIWFVVNPFSMGALYLNAVTTGTAISFAFVLFNVNRNNIVDILEAKHGRRIDSMIATTDNLASKLAVAGATLLTTALLGNAGYDGKLSVQPAGAISVINFMLGWAPLIAAVIMLAASALLPIEKEYEEAKEKLRAAAEEE